VNVAVEGQVPGLARRVRMVAIDRVGQV
jgi:hypothetical protein